jgi:hypothetical protein
MTRPITLDRLEAVFLVIAFVMIGALIGIAI